MTMAEHSTESLSARIDALRDALPRLIEDHPDDADFWPAYAELADELKRDAGTLGDEIWNWAFDLMQAALYEHGKISADELDP